MQERESWITSYRKLIEKWNPVLHLTSRGADIDRLIRESLYIKDIIPEGAVVLDVGSGGGFPMVPVAAERKDIKVYLVERSLKKSVFLNNVKRELDLRNVQVINADYRNLNIDEKVDVITSRALGNHGHLIKRLSEFLKDGGFFLIYGDLRNEVPEGWSVEVMHFPTARVSRVYRAGKVPRND